MTCIIIKKMLNKFNFHIQLTVFFSSNLAKVIFGENSGAIYLKMIVKFFGLVEF